MSLNEAQGQAVRHRGSGLLVLAGAGTGKTRVLTHRIADLVQEGIPEDQILAVTFTNKAAKEMKHRLHRMDVGKSLWVGTFHSIGLRILKKFGDRLGYHSNFTICDDDSQKSLVKAIAADVPFRGSRPAESYVNHLIQDLKTSGLGPSAVDTYGSEIPKNLVDFVREVFTRYEASLKRSNAMDFADLLLNTVKLLKDPQDDAVLGLTRQFKHVLVDEYQDTNAVQMSMVDLLSQEGYTCVVGDDDQSLYSWRGADPDGMMRFSQRTGVKLVRLEENYRCTMPILACANALIAKNSKRLGKTLRTNKPGELVRVSRFGDERIEARAVASSIRTPWEDHAVLYRTHAQSRPIEEALRQRSIPYVIIGGLRFYDRAEIKDMMAFFRLAVNLKADMDLLRVANKPSRGMGPKKMGALKTLATEKGISMFKAIPAMVPQDEALQKLLQILLDLNKAKDEAPSLLDFYKQVLKITKYRGSLIRTIQESESPTAREKAQAQLANVDELANDISTFGDDRIGATVEDYLEHVALVSSFDKEGGSAVPLMTIHAAKGLEFSHVHLVGFEEGLLPHENSLKEKNPKKRFAAIEEERRLAYVAITRAKDKLDITLTSVRAHQGKSDSAQPSQFLAELPKDQYVKNSFPS